jgi:hypothetical protein
VRFVADDELEIRRGELVQEAVARGQALNGRHHHLCLFPILPLLFVDDGADAVVGEVGVEVLPRLILQLQPVHEEEDAVGVLGAEIQLGDGRAQERLARAGGHLEQKPMLRWRRSPLKRPDGVQLVIAQQADFLVHHHLAPLGG